MHVLLLSFNSVTIFQCLCLSSMRECLMETQLLIPRSTSWTWSIFSPPHRILHRWIHGKHLVSDLFQQTLMPGLTVPLFPAPSKGLEGTVCALICASPEVQCNFRCALISSRVQRARSSMQYCFSSRWVVLVNGLVVFQQLPFSVGSSSVQSSWRPSVSIRHSPTQLSPVSWPLADLVRPWASDNRDW